MKRSMVSTVQVVFVAIFLAAAVGLLFLHPSARQPGPGNDPQAQCEARGDWWDPQDRVCAVPTPLSTITGHAGKPAQ
ncbi:MAG TPA: hypothetical protein VHZ26_11020 [Caulobacteraceae bacterium]|jgi:hypothetical protein|nr:hypothetical protein [Caulobacteraceae bacterium]